MRRIVEDTMIDFFGVYEQFAEILKEFTSCFNNLLAEDVFLSINVEVWKSFLCRI
jgi:hypothetical protein